MFDNLKENQEINARKTADDNRMAVCAAVIDAKAAAHSYNIPAQEIHGIPGASRTMQYDFAISTGSATNNGVQHAVNKKKEDPGLLL